MATGRTTKKKVEGISYEEFRKQIKAGKIESLYLFVGDETYHQDRAVALLKGMVDEAMRMFNYASFSIGESVNGSKTTPAMAIDNANQLPMMSSRRLTII